jgi:hypothetical protein
VYSPAASAPPWKVRWPVTLNETVVAGLAIVACAVLAAFGRLELGDFRAIVLAVLAYVFGASRSSRREWNGAVERKARELRGGERPSSGR